MQFIIVTGMSGSGKSGAINVLEDIGFYCVDNMPPEMISQFCDICVSSKGKMSRAAVVIDIRGGDFFYQLAPEIRKLAEKDISPKVLFLDADNEVLVKRYKETRRKHPLDKEAGGSIQKAIEIERDILKEIRSEADYYIDTSFLSTSQFKEQINALFLDNVADSMIVKVMSFGFKYGAPNEADLVFDVRCLPNPFYIAELKHHTGKEKCVRDYVMQFKQSNQLIVKLKELIDFLLPLYIHEGKSQLVIAFGCTGGKHRSVTFAEEIYSYLKNKDLQVRISNRDIDKDR